MPRAILLTLAVLALAASAGAKTAPWKLGMSYANDVVTLRHKRLEDGAMRFSAH